MESCPICQFGIRPKLTPRNYQKWGALIIGHLREHKEVFPSLYLKIVPSFEYLSSLLRFMYRSMSQESFAPLLMASFPHDVWMALWEAYGDSHVPPFLEDILHPLTPAMVSSTPDEITPLAHVAPTHLVLAIDASDSVQQEIPCLLTSASWDDFLPDIARLFMESHIEDVGDIIDDIHLLFVEETYS